MTEDDTPESHPRLPEIEAEEPAVTRDVTLGEADGADFTAADTAPVAEHTTEALVEQVQAGSAPERRRAILALSEREPDHEVYQTLEAVIRHDDDPEARQFAVEVLADLDGPVAPVESALGDDTPWVRAEAIVSLKRMAPDAHAETFERRLLDPHPAVRRNALVSLHHVRGSESREILEAALHDVSERVREWAVRFLGEIDDENAGEAIEDVLEGEESEVVQDAAARAITGETRRSDVLEGEGTADANEHVLNRRPGR
ncbi:MAG: HEAT repeat domain-containing protein [Halodesulfurarchaeum sp.]